MCYVLHKCFYTFRLIFSLIFFDHSKHTVLPVQSLSVGVTRCGFTMV